MEKIEAANKLQNLGYFDNLVIDILSSVGIWVLCLPEGVKMKRAKNILLKKNSNLESLKPVCFFCRSKIEAGEIVLRKESGFYHRKCFNLLLNLTKNHVLWEKYKIS